jgi:PAS domain S-box-containing protein
MTAADGLPEGEEELQRLALQRASDLGRANRILQAEMSERLKAEAALKRSETMLRSVVENVPAIIARLNLDGTFAFVNQVIPGLSREQVLGRHITEFVPAEHRDTVAGILSAVITTGQPQACEVPGAGLHGTTALYSWRVAAVREGSEIVGLISVATDITDAKRIEEHVRELQEQLAHVARLSTMGEMASGLAHELNQPLAAIIAYADASQELVDSGRIDREKLLEVLRAISSQADRAGKIILRLRNLVRKSRPVRAPIQVNDAVREIAAVLEPDFRHAAVRLRLELCPDELLPTAPADFVQIQQVLLNLLRNALDATAGTERREVSVTTQLDPEGRIEVAIHDRGRGVSREEAERLFEPFYTTKPDGLGMGLPISRSIVEAHGGRLWLTPNPEGGMTAKFVLPTKDAGSLHDTSADRIHRG